MNVKAPNDRTKGTDATDRRPYAIFDLTLIRRKKPNKLNIANCRNKVLTMTAETVYLLLLSVSNYITVRLASTN